MICHHCGTDTIYARAVEHAHAMAIAWCDELAAALAELAPGHQAIGDWLLARNGDAGEPPADDPEFDAVVKEGFA